MLLQNFYYVGIFDDQILLYNDKELTLATINDALFHAVVQGGPLLINDGYLMHFEDGRRALTESASSPLTKLLQTGFVKLFSRTGGDLAAMPKKMEHIPTYKKLLDDPRRNVQVVVRFHKRGPVHLGWRSGASRSHCDRHVGRTRTAGCSDDGSSGERGHSPGVSTGGSGCGQAGRIAR